MSDEHKNKEKDIDELSGIETTGHEWDGLKELNNPLPRWWVWCFLITIIWSLWYFVMYPAWPTLSTDNQGGTVGMLGENQYTELARSQQEIVQRQAAYLERFEKASFEEIMNDEELYRFAMAGGASAFKDNCATCHGTGGEGGMGYPNLNDDDWIWGGQLHEIHDTLLHGIRVQGDLDTRISQMPAFGKDKLLKREEVSAVTDYVLTLSGGEKLKGFEKGQAIFQQQCASCHGADGSGDHEFGAPNLTDAIWLYGGERQTIFETIYYSRAGMMPAWKDRLDDNTIRQLSVYIHQLGGGEDTQNKNPEDVMPQAGGMMDNEIPYPEAITPQMTPGDMIEGENGQGETSKE